MGVAGGIGARRLLLQQFQVSGLDAELAVLVVRRGENAA
jgi:hypothetical protein